MAVHEISCNRPEIIFWLPHHPVLSHLEEDLEKRVRLILLEKLLVPLLVLDDPGLIWMVSDVDLFQGFRLFHLGLGISNYHLSSAKTLPLH